MELEVFNNLTRTKEIKEPVDITFCNEFGQVGLLKNVLIIDADKKSNIVTALVDCKSKKKMEVKFVLDNSSKNTMNSFHALIITKYVKKKKTPIYVNENSNKLLHSTKKYSFHMDQPYVKKWRKDEAVDFLLKNLGHYVSIVEGKEKYNGIVKSLNYDVNDGVTMITLMQSEKVLRPHKLADKCKIVSYKNENTLKYEREQELVNNL